MSHSMRLVFVLLSLLVAVGIHASGQTYRFDGLDEPYVLSGDDIGFRVEGYVGEIPAGRLVIRTDGRWVEPNTLSRATVVPAR